MPDYTEFLRAKVRLVERGGFDLDGADLHPGNFPHQDDAIRWAAGLGRALFDYLEAIGAGEVVPAGDNGHGRS